MNATKNPNLPRLVTGDLRRYSEWGTYPLIYLTSDLRVICADCATETENDPEALETLEEAHVVKSLAASCDICGDLIDPNEDRAGS